MFKPHTSAIYTKSIIVDYFGIPIMVPIKHGITHIATDRDGEVFGFIGEPVMCKGDIWVLDLEGNSGEGCEYLATIGFAGNWTESLLTLDPLTLLELA